MAEAQSDNDLGPIFPFCNDDWGPDTPPTPTNPTPNHTEVPRVEHHPDLEVEEDMIAEAEPDMQLEVESLDENLRKKEIADSKKASLVQQGFTVNVSCAQKGTYK